jgi:hypothetical protein
MKQERRIRNIGPVSEEWLRAAGIQSQEDLEAIGSVEAYRRVRLHGFNASLNLLYALEGAIRDLPWNSLPEPVKARLKSAAQVLR